MFTSFCRSYAVGLTRVAHVRFYYSSSPDLLVYFFSLQKYVLLLCPELIFFLLFTFTMLWRVEFFFLFFPFWTHYNVLVWGTCIFYFVVIRNPFARCWRLARRSNHKSTTVIFSFGVELLLFAKTTAPSKGYTDMNDKENTFVILSIRCGRRFIRWCAGNGFNCWWRGVMGGMDARFQRGPVSSPSIRMPVPMMLCCSVFIFFFLPSFFFFYLIWLYYVDLLIITPRRPVDGNTIL